MRILQTLIILSIAFGCIYTNQMGNEVQSALTHFPDTLVDHFPINIKNSIYGYSYRETKNTFKNFGKSIDVVYILSKNDFEDYYYNNNLSTISKLDKDGKYEFFGDKSNIAFDGIVLYNDSIPLPSLISIEACFNDRDTIMERLPSDFEIYFIDANEGVYLSHDELIKDSIIPQPWQHGYSRGYAISKQRNALIVWLTFW